MLEIEIELPDGEVVRFPAGTPDAEIKAELRKRFPPPRPTLLAPGEAAKRAHAVVSFNDEFERFAIHALGGGFLGFRRTLDAAIDSADTSQPPPPPRVKPKPAPQPEKLLSPLAAEVDLSIRLQESRKRSERREATRQRRYKNSGTLG